MGGCRGYPWERWWPAGRVNRLFAADGSSVPDVLKLILAYRTSRNATITLLGWTAVAHRSVGERWVWAESSDTALRREPALERNATDVGYLLWMSRRETDASYEGFVPRARGWLPVMTSWLVANLPPSDVAGSLHHRPSIIRTAIRVFCQLVVFYNEQCYYKCLESTRGEVPTKSNTPHIS